MRLARKGKLATAAHRLGGQAFGLAPRAQRRAEQAAALQRRSRDELETDLKNRRATLRKDQKAAHDLAQASGTQLRFWQTREVLSNEIVLCMISPSQRRLHLR